MRGGARAGPAAGRFVAAAFAAALAGTTATPANSESACLAEAATLPPRTSRERTVVVPPGRGWELDHLGNRLFDRARLPAALSCFDASVRAMRAEGDRCGEGIALKDRGIANRYLSYHEAGLDDLTLAEEILGRLEPGSPAHLSAIENLGMSYVQLGAYERGLALYDRSLAMAREQGHRGAVYGGLVRLADAALGLDRPELALEQFDAALPLAGDADLIGTDPEIWPGIGAAIALARLGRLDEALVRVERALQLARREGEPGGLSDVLSIKGVLVARRDPASGVAIIREALEIQRKIEPHQPWGMQGRLAHALRLNGELDAAIEYGRRAIEMLERTAPGSAPVEFRPTYIETHQSLYAELAEALLERAEIPGADAGNSASDRAGAFAVIEAGRSLRFADTPADAIVRRAGCEPSSVAAALGPSRALVEFAFTREGAAIFLIQGGGLEVFRVTQGPDQIADRVAAYVDLLRDGDENAAAIVAGRLSEGLVAPWIAHLDSRVREIVIVPAGVLNALPFEYLPAGGTGEAGVNDAAATLLDRAAVSYLPSASLLSGAPQPPASDSPADILFVLGGVPGSRTTPGSQGERAAFAGSSPDRWLTSLFEAEGFEVPLAALSPLPGARREVESLERYAGPGGLVVRGDEMPAGTFSRLDLDRFDILHFATHGLVSDRAPERSALLIGSGPATPSTGAATDVPAAAPGAWLQARDISHWRLRADLVVLSACRTASGRILTGEGTQSLARAFLDAGARGVIASLWLADDSKTAVLMDAYYAEMASGKIPVEALRAAKLRTARDGTVPLDSRASFVLLGAGDRLVRLRDDSPSLLWPWVLLGPAAALATAIVAAIARRRG